MNSLAHFPDSWREHLAFEELLRVTRRNRFLPVPPQERNFVGDGDFLAIGCEFLRYFVEMGDLHPQDRVLEIGCGLGRMAIPLTQFLAPPAGRYVGFDVVAEGISWAQDNVTTAYGNFEFHHIDYRNQLYNPTGLLEPENAPLPLDPGSVDFLFMTSVVTHLDARDISFYFKEAARLLRPNGRFFVTAFLLDDANRALVKAGKARPAFSLTGAGPDFVSDPTHPMAAVAVDLDWFLATGAEVGLHLARPPAFGHWSGRVSGNFQDICVFVRSAAQPKGAPMS